MKYWLQVGFLEGTQVLDVAVAAERCGFEGVTVPDHLLLPETIGSNYPYSADGAITWPAEAPWLDCWVTIAAMAAVTQRLRFSTSVYVAPLRDVFNLAKGVATAAAIAPGRVSCGFGAGWMREEFDTVGQPFATRGARFDEMLEVLPLLWSGEQVEYHGEHIDFAPLTMRPAAGRVPVLVGGNTKHAIRRAARSDGWIGSFSDIDGVRRMLVDLVDERDRYKRGGGAFEVLFAAWPGVAKHAAELDELGVDGLIIPAITVAPTTTTTDMVAGLERFAERHFDAG